MKQVENIERIEDKKAIEIRAGKEGNYRETERQKRLQIALISHQCYL